MNREGADQRFRPGDHVRWYAEACGWQLSRRTVLVEGDTDAKYLHLAAELYYRQNGLRLLDAEIGVVAAGFGQEGGTFGIVEKFPALRQLIQRDCGPDGRPLFRAVALLDDDQEGHNACSYLTGRYTSLHRNRDVFVLQRRFPRVSQDPRLLIDFIKKANEPWHTLDCEIEDLLDRDLLDVFLEENRGAVRVAPQYVNDGHHFDFTAKGKSDLCRWVPKVANLKNLGQMVEILKSIRYYFGLQPDGS